MIFVDVVNDMVNILEKLESSAFSNYGVVPLDSKYTCWAEEPLRIGFLNFRYTCMNS